jgi:uncharacterized repeat protein (TIGR01451 family)
MRHAIWKLAALGSVVGIGLLVVVQAQKNLHKSDPASPAGQQETGEGSAPSESTTASLPAASMQSEPNLGPEDFKDLDVVPADVKTGVAATMNRPSRTRAPDRLSGDDPFNMADDLDGNRPAREAPAAGAAAKPTISIADLDDPDDSFGKALPAKPAGKKAAPGRVPLSLDDDVPSIETNAGPKLILGDAPGDTEDAGPRLLSATEAEPRPAPAKNKSADPFGDEELNIPASRPNAERKPAAAPARLPAADDDPFNFDDIKKPTPASPAAKNAPPRNAPAVDAGGEDDFKSELGTRAQPRPANSAAPGKAQSPTLSDDEFMADPIDRKPSRTNSAPPRGTLDDDDFGMDLNTPSGARPTTRPAPGAQDQPTLADDAFRSELETAAPVPSRAPPARGTPASPTLTDDDLLLDSAGDRSSRSTKPAVPRSPVMADDPFGEELPPRRPAASPLKDEAGVDEQPAKTIDDEDAFPRSRPAPAGRLGRDEPAPTLDEMPRRGTNSIGLPPRLSEDDADALPTREPTRETAPRESRPGVTRPAPSLADPFGDEPTIDAKPRPAPSLADPVEEKPAPQPAVSDDDFPRGIGRPARSPELDSEPVVVPAPRGGPKPPVVPIEDEPAAIGRPAQPDPVPVQPAPPRRPVPQVSIEKVAPETAHLNQPMIYDIFVKNGGATPAHEVTVEDTVPRGVKLVGSIPRALSDGNRLIWKLGTLEAGENRKISVKIIPQSEGVIGTVATVNVGTGAGAPVNLSAPKLKLELEAPRQVTVGAPVVLNFRISNVGPVDATGVMLREVIPGALRHPEGDDLEYEIGALPAGGTREVKLTLTAAQAGRAVNRAVVTADGALSEESELQVEVVGPSLRVSRAGPKKVYLNKVGTFTNSVTNPGSTAAAGLTLVETVPAGLEFVSATDGGEFNAAKRQVVWNISRLEPGESKKVQVTLSANGRGAQVSVLRAYDNGGASGEDVTTINVAGFAVLSIDVSEIPSVIEVGEGVTLQVHVRNRGTDVATNVRPTIVVPNGLQLVTAKGPGKYREANVATPVGDPGARTFRNQHEIQFDPIASLDPRDEVTLELTLQARAAGSGRLQLAVQSDKIPEPIRREELVHVVAAPE